MHEDAVVLDDTVVRTLVSTQFPQWEGLALEPVDSDGNLNVLYRLGTELVVRLPRVPHGQSDLARELEWLPHLAGHLPVAIPVPVAIGEPGVGYPQRWAVYSWLGGEAAATSGSPSRAEMVARDLADVIQALRRIPASGGPAGFRSRDLVTRDPEVRAALAGMGKAHDVEALSEIWEAALGAPRWTGPPVWTHGDLLPGNVLVRAGRLAGLIDFGCAGVGDPACDLMPAWTVFTDHARAIFRRAADADAAMWARARGWALSVGVVGCAYFAESNRSFAVLARRIVDEVLAGA